MTETLYAKRLILLDRQCFMVFLYKALSTAPTAGRGAVGHHHRACLPILRVFKGLPKQGNKKGITRGTVKYCPIRRGSYCWLFLLFDPFVVLGLRDVGWVGCREVPGLRSSLRRQFQGKGGECSRMLIPCEDVTHLISAPSDQALHSGTPGLKRNEPPREVLAVHGFRRSRQEITRLLGLSS